VSRSGAAIGELHDLADLRELEALLSAIWGKPDDPPINVELLRALAHSGNYVAGARAGGRLIGGLVGWLGVRGANELHMHSHILGVVADVQAVGVGFELKQDQRRWCLERGVKTVEWTTDPLVRRNAYFNLTKLGASSSEYLVNFYGAMTDGLNAGEESDRILISWELESRLANAAAEGGGAEPDVAQLVADGAIAILSVGSDGEPLLGKASGARVLICQVPADIVAIRHADPSLARLWRLALREALHDTLLAGYAVMGATRTGWYVLEDPRPE
jgi:predicted GNAT superfamily acetyltransferase